MSTQKSWKGKGTYLVYKSDNRVMKNKIKKLEHLVKEFPHDLAVLNRLDEIKKSRTYKCRAKPLIPGSNPTIPKIKSMATLGFVHAKTAGEQLSKLLGIPLILTTRKPKRKAKVTIRKKKYVKS